MLSMWDKMKYNGVMVNGTYLKLRYVKDRTPTSRNLDVTRLCVLSLSAVNGSLAPSKPAGLVDSGPHIRLMEVLSH